MRRHTGGDADRHGQHVVDEQRRRGDEGGRLSDVLLRDDVGAAAARVGMDGLPVREDDNGQNRGDDKGDRRRKGERADARRASSTRRISSVAYATDDSGSDESTARPVNRDSRS